MLKALGVANGKRRLSHLQAARSAQLRWAASGYQMCMHWLPFAMYAVLPSANSKGFTKGENAHELMQPSARL